MLKQPFEDEELKIFIMQTNKQTKNNTFHFPIRILD